MSKDFQAVISHGSARYPEWLEVMGTGTIPLKSPFPVMASAPGVEVGYFYQIDLREITAEQRVRMIKFIARKFGVDEQEVRLTLDEVGCPILADDVTVTVHNPQKWL